MQKEIPLQKLKDKHSPDSKRIELARWGKITNSYDFSRPHRHNYFEILLFFKGGGRHEIDFTQYGIKNHSIHFVAANAVHLLRRHPQSDGATILFSEDFFYNDASLNTFFKNSDFYSGKNGHVLNLKKPEFTLFESIFFEMNEVIEKKDVGSVIVIKSLLTLFLGKAEQYFYLINPEENKISRKNALIERYKLLVEKGFLEHRSISAYADELHISPKHLNDLCKQHLSLTAQKVIHERLLLEIKRLLIHTDLTIKEVCYQSGFEDPAHFNHFFRFHLQITPLQYRKSTR